VRRHPFMASESAGIKHSQIGYLLHKTLLEYENYNDSLFFTNLMHRFFILIHLLYSSTFSEHYYAVQYTCYERTRVLS